VAEYYQWFVLVHLIGLSIFLAGHGVAMFLSFRVRRERDRGRVEELLTMSGQGSQASLVGLLILVLGGLGAAWVGGILLAPWVVASDVVLIVVYVLMSAIASPYYYRMRNAFTGRRGTEPIDDAELFRRLDSRRPEALAAIGTTGLIVLLWLMVLKPA
jgi:NADH:ubiquinone oxidoreductase subunit 2 (subunit N)